MDTQEILQILYNSISESIKEVEFLQIISDNPEFRFSLVGAAGAGKGIQDTIRNLAAVNGLTIVA